MRGNGAVVYKPDNVRHDRFCVKLELQVVQCCQQSSSTWCFLALSNVDLGKPT